MFDDGCGFVVNGYYYVEICFIYLNSVEGFYYEQMLNLVKNFLNIY